MIGIDTENEFDRIVRDAEFAYQLMEQNREMERFVNESIILASGNRSAINEMVIIHEAAAGDKIKGFFEKIKNFFKKIFDKLGASMSALFKEQKDYIDKYAYIITKCKWNVGDVTDIYDHFKGLPRIISVIDTGENAILGTNMDKYFNGENISNDKDKDLFIDTNTFESKDNVISKLDKMKKEPIDPNKIRTDAFNNFISTGYWAGLDGFAAMKQNDSNGNVNAADTFKAWFNGSADTITYSGDDMENNFQTVINVCYGGQSYLNKLEKIVTTVNKKMDDATKAMENYHKAQKEKILEYAKKEGGNVKTVSFNIEKKGENNYTLTIGNEYLKQGKSGSITGNSVDDVINKANEAIDTTKCTPDFKKPDEKGAKKPDGNKEPENKKEVIKYRIDVDKNKSDNDAGKYTASYTPSAPDGAPTASTPGQSITAFIGTVRTAITNAGKTPEVIANESFNIYRDYKNFFNESPNFGSGSSSSGTDTKGPTGAGAEQSKNAGETNTRLSNVTANNMKTNDNISVAGGVSKEAEELLNLDIKNREAKINADVMVSTAIATAAFNAFKLTNSDFFGAIKAHVQWYLSNPGAEKASENQTTRTKSLDMNAAGPSVTSSKPTSEKTETTEKKEGTNA